MIGKIVVKKFSEMKKEDEELYFPKTLNCSYVDQDLELLSKDYIKEIDNFRLINKFNNPLKDSMYNDLVGTKLRRTLLQQGKTFRKWR